MNRLDELRLQSEPFGKEHAVPGNVLGVALRVAVLGIHGEYEPLKDVEAGRCRGCLIGLDAGDANGIAAARTSLLQGRRRRREELSDRQPVVRERADARADADWKSLGGLELQAQHGEVRPDPIDRGLQIDHEFGADDDEELVGPVAAHHRTGRQVPTNAIRHGKEDTVAGGVPMVVVEESEVVEVDETDTERGIGGAGQLDVAREPADQRAVVQQPGQRVETSRFDERRGLPLDCHLSGPEHQPKDDRGDQGGCKSDDHDVGSKPVEPGEDRDRVAPQRHDEDGAVTLPDRQVLAKDARRQCGAIGFGRRRVDDRDPGLSCNGRGEVVTGDRGRADGGRAVGCDDSAVRGSDLGMNDAALGQKRAELLVDGEDRRLVGVRATAAGKLLVNEPTNRGDVTFDDRSEGGC